MAEVAKPCLKFLHVGLFLVIGPITSILCFVTNASGRNCPACGYNTQHSTLYDDDGGSSDCSGSRWRRRKLLRGRCSRGFPMQHRRAAAEMSFAGNCNTGQRKVQLSRNDLDVAGIFKVSSENPVSLGDIIAENWDKFADLRDRAEKAFESLLRELPPDLYESLKEDLLGLIFPKGHQTKLRVRLVIDTNIIIQDAFRVAKGLSSTTERLLTSAFV